MRVLIVDDDLQILRALRIDLTARGHDVVTTRTAREAVELALGTRPGMSPPDLVLLDLGLPDGDGVDVVSAVRERSQVPILILSGRLDSAAKVRALDAGADDYVTKPFSVDELLARVRAVTRRTASTAPHEPVRVGAHLVDFAERRVTAAEEGAGDVHLTPTEWHLLEVLARNPGRLVAQRQLLQEVWGPAYRTETHYLRQYLKTLRQKLEPEPARPRHLITEPGMGYRFQP